LINFYTQEKTMNRLTVGAIIAGMLLALFCSSVVSASPILSIVPATQTVAAGSSVTLDVNISDVTDLFAFQFDLSFAPSVLSANSIAEGPFLPSGGTTFFLPGTIDNTNGTISATADSLIGAISGVSGSGSLAEFTFTAIAAGTTSIDLSNVTLLDSSFDLIDASLQSGTVVVTANTGVTPEPNSLALMFLGMICLTLKFLRRI
jgi:adhesin HecA-like repeat protein